jgi:arylsulfatase A-like enzyme
MFNNPIHILSRSRVGTAGISIAAALAVAFSAVLSGCGRSAPPTRKHVLVLTIDTLRHDHLSSAGYDLSTTPFIDGLLSDGVVFDHAVTPIPRTTQALASMLTGTYPHTHGVRTLFDTLSDDVTTITELAGEAGYKTIAVVSNHILTRERGLDRGFDVYDFGTDARDAEGTTAAAIEQLKKVGREDKLFVWVHYIDPHVPYYPPREIVNDFTPGYDGRYRWHFGAKKGGIGNHAYPKDLPKPKAVFRNPLPDDVNSHIRRLYAADIRYTDDAVAGLVTWLRKELGEDWVIVFASDHGESLGEHDYFYDHGDYVYNATLRVPLGIVFPKEDPLHRAGRVKGWVSLADITPTLADLMNLETKAIDGQLESRSLVPSLRGEPLPPEPVFAECGKAFFPDLVRRRTQFNVAGRFRSVIDGDWKLIWTPGQEDSLSFELYNLAADPGETKNLHNPEHPEARRLTGLLSGWLKNTPHRNTAPSDADMERLKSLGYI